MKTKIILAVICIFSVLCFAFNSSTETHRYFMVGYNAKTPNGGHVIGSIYMQIQISDFRYESIEKSIREYYVENDKMTLTNVVLTGLHEFKSRKEYEQFQSK